MGDFTRFTIDQIREVRRGFLLAQNDHKALKFQVKYEKIDPKLAAEWVEIFDDAEEVIMGKHMFTKLTWRAYAHTMDSLREREVLKP